MYELDPNQLDFQDLEKCTVILDKNGRVVALMLEFPDERFDELFSQLKSKYKLVQSRIPFVGDKFAKFVDGDTEIHLDAPHLSFTLYLIYMHKDFVKTYRDLKNKEEIERKTKERLKL